MIVLSTTSTKEITLDFGQAQDLCINKMREHGLSPIDWKFQWMNSRNALGQTRFRRRWTANGEHIFGLICLSKPYVEILSEEEILDTILHEIAHALAGPGENHGNVWKMHARAIGARPERVAHGAPSLPGKWKGTCPSGHVVYMAARGRFAGTKSCAKCSRSFDTRFLLTWTETATGRSHKEVWEEVTRIEKEREAKRWARYEKRAASESRRITSA